VLEAASQSWGKFQARFDRSPLTLHLEVSSDCESGSSDLSAPICRIRRHVVSNITDPCNFAISDQNTGFAFGFVTPQAAASLPYLRYHIIESAVLCMIATLRAALFMRRVSLQTDTECYSAETPEQASPH
jgi:hypothetical protein